MAQSLLYSEHFKALQCHILETKEFRFQIHPFQRFPARMDLVTCCICHKSPKVSSSFFKATLL